MSRIGLVGYGCGNGVGSGGDAKASGHWNWECDGRWEKGRGTAECKWRQEPGVRWGCGNGGGVQGFIRRGDGGGSGAQKCVYQTCLAQISPTVNVIFSDDCPFGQGGGASMVHGRSSPSLAAREGQWQQNWKQQQDCGPGIRCHLGIGAGPSATGGKQIPPSHRQNRMPAVTLQRHLVPPPPPTAVGSRPHRAASVVPVQQGNSF